MASKNRKNIFLLYMTLAVFVTSCVVPPTHTVDNIPPGLSKNKPPPGAPAHGRRKKTQYHYYYYPSAEVYFDGVRRMYFYMEAGSWLMAPRLPARINININTHVSVELDGDKPYLYHKEVLRKYPPGQLKKKHGKKKKKENKGKGKWR